MVSMMMKKEMIIIVVVVDVDVHDVHVFVGDSVLVGTGVGVFDGVFWETLLLLKEKTLTAMLLWWKMTMIMMMANVVMLNWIAIE